MSGSGRRGAARPRRTTPPRTHRVPQISRDDEIWCVLIHGSGHLPHGPDGRGRWCPVPSIRRFWATRVPGSSRPSASVSPDSRRGIPWSSASTPADPAQLRPGAGGLLEKRNRPEHGGTRLDGTTTLTGTDGTALHGQLVRSILDGVARGGLARNAVRLPPDVPVALAGPLGCGLQTGRDRLQTSCARIPDRRSWCSGSAPWGWRRSWPRADSGCGNVIAVDPISARRTWRWNWGDGGAVAVDVDDVGRAVRPRVRWRCGSQWNPWGVGTNRSSVMHCPRYARPESARHWGYFPDVIPSRSTRAIS